MLPWKLCWQMRGKILTVKSLFRSAFSLFLHHWTLWVWVTWTSWCALYIVGKKRGKNTASEEVSWHVLCLAFCVKWPDKMVSLRFFIFFFAIESILQQQVTLSSPSDLWLVSVLHGLLFRVPGASQRAAVCGNYKPCIFILLIPASPELRLFCLLGWCPELYTK